MTNEAISKVEIKTIINVDEIFTFDTSIVVPVFISLIQMKLYL